MNTRMKTLLLSLLSLGLTSVAFAAHHESDAATTASDDAYPMNTCVVSGEELGGMGDPYVYTYKEAGKPDREVRFCCKMCVGRFEKNPAKYLAKLDAAAEAGSHTDKAEGHSMEHRMDGHAMEKAKGKDHS